MDLSKLEILRDKLMNGTDFSDAVTYFMDHFGENQEFIGLGKPGRNEVVEAGVKNVLKEALHREVRIVHILLVQVPKTDFWHGPFMADKGYGTFFYFKKNNMGMVTAQFDELHGPTLFARFTALPIHQPSDPRVN